MVFIHCLLFHYFVVGVLCLVLPSLCKVLSSLAFSLLDKREMRDLNFVVAV